MSDLREYIRARAPLRIGLAGGGTDVEPYASLKGGAVFNTTIDKYAYCTLHPNNTSNVTVTSLDYGDFQASLDGGPLPYDGNLDLIKVVTNHFGITDGFDMFIHSDAPPGSGLGGSSTVIVSIIAAVTEWLGDEMSRHEMAELAFRLEREELNLSGGKQDQFTAAYGGFNYMEFGKTGVKVNPVLLSDDIVNELQYCSLLCYSGQSRESALIIDTQVASFKRGTNEDVMGKTKALVGKMRDSLLSGDIVKTGELLDETWRQKKLMSSMVSNGLIDSLYSLARECGAIGGKVSGAGGGGFMYFICEYDKKHMVAKELRKRGAIITDFMFDPKGVTVWRSYR